MLLQKGVRFLNEFGERFVPRSEKGKRSLAARAIFLGRCRDVRRFVRSFGAS
jgi:hypothetical protein